MTITMKLGYSYILQAKKNQNKTAHKPSLICIFLNPRTQHTFKITNTSEN